MRHQSTLEWRQTFLVLVEVRGGGLTGLGYSYASYGSAYVTKELLADIVMGRDAFGVEECWWSRHRRFRKRREVCHGFSTVP